MVSSFILTVSFGLIGLQGAAPTLNFHANTLLLYLVTYATREEALDAIKQTNDYNQPRKMMLDVYTAIEKPAGLRPVLVRI
jgi:hypothetical protein